MSEKAHRSRHCCPLVMGTRRYGSWVECRCGWLSGAMTTGGGAAVAWANHYADTLSRTPPPDPATSSEETTHDH